MMEWNPGKAVKNNVFGTKTLADAANSHGRTMGVSKRTAEIYIQALSQRSQTRFVTVRFGNVLGSAGSVPRAARSPSPTPT